MQDEALYRLLQQGKEKALSAIFDKYFQDLCFYSFQITKSKEHTEEVVADVFIKIWENRKQVHILNLKNYLYKSVKNGSLQVLKNVKTHYCIDDNQLEPLIQTTNFESQIIEKELLEHVIRIINKMPEKRRIIFQLNRFNGLKYKEIADLLNISLSTVQNQMILAIQYMHENFSKNYNSK